MGNHHSKKGQNPSYNEVSGAGNKTSRARTSSTNLADGKAKAYEVFLSFRGEETRKSFTDHLYQRLVNAGVTVFEDDKMIHAGKEISLELVKGIKASKVSIPIISSGYASSEWCLQELVHLLNCRKTTGQVVLPIFYRVDPSSVRRQTKTFKKAFRSHEKKYGSNSKVVQDWRNALIEVASLKGWESSKIANGHEGQLVEIVVTRVLSELKISTSTVRNYSFGIEDHKEKILKMIEGKKSSGAKVIVIHGMSGVGKTTLAKVIFDQLSTRFKYRSYLSNIHQKSSEAKCCLEELQKQLISDILGKQWKSEISHVDGRVNKLKDRLKQKKVLVLFDDVDHSDQLNALARESSWYKPGSILIITTRNRDILKSWKGKLTYELERWNCSHFLRKHAI